MFLLFAFLPAVSVICFLLFTYNSISLIDIPFSFLLSTSLIKLCPNVW